jgi:hypothetical protein
MDIISQTPKRSLNKAFLKQRPLRSEIDLFKHNLIRLLGKIDEIEREENQKNHIRDFLRDTYYKDTNEINTKDFKDLVIHLGKSNKENVGVIVEAKRPGNKAEMLSADKPNAKALHEIILYYLDERIIQNNSELKTLIITNVYEWFIFDANFFDKHIYRNSKIKKLFDIYRNDKKDTSFFYEELSKIIPQIVIDIPCTYFDIRDYEKVLKNDDLADDKNLIALFKILSPYHLLKEPFADDSNKLDERFYKELLHIIGLEEAKEGGKNVIRRKTVNRDAGSLMENIINILETEDVFHNIPDISRFGEQRPERLFNVALELSITWINRILFLKLLEGQLFNYHKGDEHYHFLNIETINDYDELYKLFHQVLARTHADRPEAVKTKYSHIPHLNSSLFEISELEHQTIKINALDNSAVLDLMKGSVLSKSAQKSKLPSLEYLFMFLDSYDFANEGTEDIQDDSKTLVNASVLGKVFEKINGYKDGSIFTPGFITMYMCRQAIRPAIVQKFKDTYNWNVEKFGDLKNYLADRKSGKDILEFNSVINSLRICDPAVGSGHFLVSSLNELIVAKSELGIFADENGNRLTDYEIVIENDELIIIDLKGDLFTYSLNTDKTTFKCSVNKEAQRLQKTLFHEKQSIIENCLFGVDINQNSVKICRLRLWIELLKNAYYKEESKYTELETLPNIDINIKCGNSLLYRFALDSDLSVALKTSKYSVEQYRGFVNSYKQEKNRDSKRELEKIINSIKSNFRTEISKNDPKLLRFHKLNNEYNALANQTQMFEETKKQIKERTDKQAKLQKAIAVLKKELDEIKTNAVYKNAFEWRIEFPEVLNNEGKFIGFDVIIGNPPYGAEIPNRDVYKEKYPLTSKGQIDTYKYFIELSMRLSKPNTIYTYITSDSFLEKKYFKDVRELIYSNSSFLEITKLGDNIFDGVNLPTAIFGAVKGNKIIEYKYKDLAYLFDNIKKSYALYDKSKFVCDTPSFDVSFVSKKSIINRENCINLIDIYDQVMGVKVYQIGKGKPKQTNYEIENNIFIATEKKDENYLPFISQGIDRYNYKSKGEFINYGVWLAEPRKLKYFSNPKIIIREIVNPRIFATYIEDPTVIKNIAAVIIAKDIKYDLKYLLALINSKLFTYYLFEQTPKSSNKSYPSFTSDLIKNMPIKNIGNIDQQPFIALVDQILEAKKQNHDTSALESQIDILVYKLYNLTPEENKIVEGKE